jgi:hypothetical protein
LAIAIRPCKKSSEKMANRELHVGIAIRQRWIFTFGDLGRQLENEPTGECSAGGEKDPTPFGRFMALISWVVAPDDCNGRRVLREAIQSVRDIAPSNCPRQWRLP